MDRDELIFQEYRMYAEQKENFIDRNFRTNRFYMISFVAIIFAMIFTGNVVFMSKISATLVFSLIGISVCALWWMNVDAYNILIKIKYANVLEVIEEKLPVKPFTDEYKGIEEFRNNKVFMFSDIQKAEYKDVTYRRLYKYYHRNNFEPGYWQPLTEQWSNEWDDTMAKDLLKVDSVSAYWADYKKQHSLSRFAKVELADFRITYFYSMIDDAYICFDITPLQGTIEQIKFTCTYGFKIDGDDGKKTYGYRYASPITKTKRGYWDIDYFERDKFKNMTVKKFLQEYDMEIEVTDVRIEGKNYSLNDLNIPEEVLNLWKEDTSENRDAVASLVNPTYVNKEQYISHKKTEDLKIFDLLCYEFSEALLQNSLLNGFKKTFV